MLSDCSAFGEAMDLLAAVSAFNQKSRVAALASMFPTTSPVMAFDSQPRGQAKQSFMFSCVCVCVCVLLCCLRAEALAKQFTEVTNPPKDLAAKLRGRFVEVILQDAADANSSDNHTPELSGHASAKLAALLLVAKGFDGPAAADCATKVQQLKNILDGIKKSHTSSLVLGKLAEDVAELKALLPQGFPESMHFQTVEQCCPQTF